MFRMLLGIAGLTLLWFFCGTGSAQPKDTALPKGVLPRTVTGDGLTVETAKNAAFAKALNQKAKTDAIDGRLLAIFARSLNPQPSVIPSETQRNLRELAARRRQLIEQLVQRRLWFAGRRHGRVGGSAGRAAGRGVVGIERRQF